MPTVKLQHKKTNVDAVARERISGHEKLCAERHEQLNNKMDVVITRLDKISKSVYTFGGGLAFLIVLLNLGLIDFKGLIKDTHGSALASEVRSK